MTLNLHPRPTTTYASLHSDDCYFGITSICTVLNWGAVKSRLNTALSYHASLASVRKAAWVQIWSREMEMLDKQCFATSCLISFFSSWVSWAFFFFALLFHSIPVTFWGMYISVKSVKARLTQMTKTYFLSYPLRWITRQIFFFFYFSIMFVWIFWIKVNEIS